MSARPGRTRLGRWTLSELASCSHASARASRSRWRRWSATARWREINRLEPGERDSEDLYQDEFDAGRREDLRNELAAVERAEARLEAGTYGLSVESGKPIPDARLEALPTAERTIEEEDPYRGL